MAFDLRPGSTGCGQIADLRRNDFNVGNVLPFLDSWLEAAITHADVHDIASSPATSALNAKYHPIIRRRMWLMSPPIHVCTAPYGCQGWGGVYPPTPRVSYTLDMRCGFRCHNADSPPEKKGKVCEEKGGWKDCGTARTRPHATTLPQPRLGSAFSMLLTRMMMVV